MQENPTKLFAELKNKLNRFIGNFETDNPNMHSEERAALDKLKNIAKQIDTKIDANADYAAEHGMIVSRIISVKPPKEIRWLFSITTLKLPDAIDTFVTTLNNSLNTFKKSLEEQKTQSTEKRIQDTRKEADEKVRLAEQQKQKEIDLEKLRALQQSETHKQQLEIEKLRMQQENEKAGREHKRQLDLEKLRMEDERKKNDAENTRIRLEAEKEKDRIRLEKEKEIETEKLHIQQLEKERKEERDRMDKEKKKRDEEKQESKKRKREDEDKKSEQQNKLMDKLTIATDELKAAKEEVKTSYQNGFVDGENTLIRDVSVIITNEGLSKEERVKRFANRLKLTNTAFFLTNAPHDDSQQPTPQNTSSNTSPDKIISENRQIQEAKNLIGDAKFKVVEALKTVCDNNEATDQEKSLAKFLIFQLLAHKNDKTIEQIIAETQKLLLEQRGFDAKVFQEKFPNIFECFSTFKSFKDTITNAQLIYAEADGFDKLYKEKYLPQDGTATNYFVHLADSLNGRPKENPTTEQKYIDNFLTNKMPHNNSFHGASKKQKTTNGVQTQQNITSTFQQQQN